MKKLLGLICIGSVLGCIMSIVWAFADHGADTANADAIYSGFTLATVFSGVFAVSAAVLAVLIIMGARPNIPR